MVRSFGDDGFVLLIFISFENEGFEDELLGFIFYDNVFKVGEVCFYMLEDKSKILSDPRNHSLMDKVYGFFKGLSFLGIENWRVRRDFVYGQEAGYDNLRIGLIESPRFESEKKNEEYFGFLLGKL